MRPVLGYLNMDCLLGTIVGPGGRDGMYYVATDISTSGRTGFSLAGPQDFRAVLEGEPQSVAELLIRRSRGIN